MDTTALDYTLLNVPINSELGFISEDGATRIRNLLTLTAYVHPHAFERGGDETATGEGLVEYPNLRQHTRFLLAVLPDATRGVWADRLAAMLGNEHVDTELAGLLVAGTRQEAAPETINLAGRLLRAGASNASVAEQTGWHIRQVQRLAAFLGTAEAREERLLHLAVDAVRYGDTVQGFASKHDLDQSHAYLLMVQGRAVLVEIGEVAA